MIESQIQKKIIDNLRKEGFFVIKLIKTNLSGIPDLLVVKHGKCFFVEVKTEKGKLSEIQKYRIEELEKYGVKTFVAKGFLEEGWYDPLRVVDIRSKHTGK